LDAKPRNTKKQRTKDLPLISRLSKKKRKKKRRKESTRKRSNNKRGRKDFKDRFMGEIGWGRSHGERKLRGKRGTPACMAKCATSRRKGEGGRKGVG